MLTGFAVALIWKLLCKNAIHGVEVYNLPLGFMAALVVNVVVSLLTPDAPAEADSPSLRTHWAPSSR